MAKEREHQKASQMVQELKPHPVFSLNESLMKKLEKAVDHLVHDNVPKYSLGVQDGLEIYTINNTSVTAKIPGKTNPLSFLGYVKTTNHEHILLAGKKAVHGKK